MTNASLPAEQIAVIELVARGWTDQRIADHLGVSVSTVRRRLRGAADHLGVHSRAAVAAAATRIGAIQKKEPHERDE